MPRGLRDHGGDQAAPDGAHFHVSLAAPGQVHWEHLAVDGGGYLVVSEDRDQEDAGPLHGLEQAFGKTVQPPVQGGERVVLDIPQRGTVPAVVHDVALAIGHPHLADGFLLGDGLHQRLLGLPVAVEGFDSGGDSLQGGSELCLPRPQGLLVGRLREL